MSTKRVCRVCRAELQATVCKYCGFKQKTIRISDSQEGFRKVSHFNRVQRNQQKLRQPQVSSENKLKLYLRQYSKMLKAAGEKFTSKFGFLVEGHDQFSKEIFQIWRAFLLKRQREGFNQAGLFKKYFHNTASGNQRGASKEQAQNNEFKIEKELNSNDDQSDEQKQLGLAYPSKLRISQQNKLESTSKLRSFYNVTLKSSLRQSVEERKGDQMVLTAVQKGFLSYLLAVDEGEMALLKVASQKYMKLLLKIRDKCVKSYLRCKQVKHELTVRSLQQPLRKEQTAYIILLFDILVCFTTHSPSTLAGMLTYYSSSCSRNVFIDYLIEAISRDDRPESPNLPQLNFELAYSIVYLTANRSGYCVSPSQVISGCGALELQLSGIQAAPEVIKNEENINGCKVRKGAQLLASFLSLKPRFNLPAWSIKATKLFGLEEVGCKVLIIMEVLIKQAIRRQSEAISVSRQGGYKFYRHPQLEQDIVVTAAILLFLKMANGLTSYPFLLQFPADLQAVAAKAPIICKLKQEGELFVTSSSFTTHLSLQEHQKQQIDQLQFSKKMYYIQAKHPLLSVSAFNRLGIRLRNLSHISSVPCEQLRRILAPYLPLEIIIRYQQASLQHLLRAILKQNRRLLGQKQKKLQSLKRQLSSDVSRQLQVIMSADQSLATCKLADRRRPCGIDKPSSNYEFLLDYGQESLRLSSRLQQLHSMELLCTNGVSYCQLSQWLLRLEGLLKPFQM